MEGPKNAQAQPSPSRQDALLRGLETMGDYCALGRDRRGFCDELRDFEAEAQHNARTTTGQNKQADQALRDIAQDLRAVDEIIDRYNYQKGALQQILLGIQSRFHWLPRHTLQWVASRLNVPLARVYTIADFYEAMSLEPRGAHLVQVCTGTACHVRGASTLLNRVAMALGIGPGETDATMTFTFKTVRCMGCCALAPVMKVDDNYYSDPNPKELEQILASYRQQEQSA